jgi:hypothetical protein
MAVFRWGNRRSKHSFDTSKIKRITISSSLFRTSFGSSCVVTKCVSTNNTCGIERRARRYSAALSALNAFCIHGAPLHSTPGYYLLFPSGFWIARFEPATRILQRAPKALRTACLYFLNILLGLRFAPGCNLTCPSGFGITRFEASNEDSSTSAGHFITRLDRAENPSASCETLCLPLL